MIRMLVGPSTSLPRFIIEAEKHLEMGAVMVVYVGPNGGRAVGVIHHPDGIRKAVGVLMMVHKREGGDRKW